MKLIDLFLKKKPAEEINVPQVAVVETPKPLTLESITSEGIRFENLSPRQEYKNKNFIEYTLIWSLGRHELDAIISPIGTWHQRSSNDELVKAEFPKYVTSAMFPRDYLPCGHHLCKRSECGKPSSQISIVIPKSKEEELFSLLGNMTEDQIKGAISYPGITCSDSLQINFYLRYGDGSKPLLFVNNKISKSIREKGIVDNYEELAKLYMGAGKNKIAEYLFKRNKSGGDIMEKLAECQISLWAFKKSNSYLTKLEQQMTSLADKRDKEIFTFRKMVEINGERVITSHTAQKREIAICLPYDEKIMNLAQIHYGESEKTENDYELIEEVDIKKPNSITRKQFKLIYRMARRK